MKQKRITGVILAVLLLVSGTVFMPISQQSANAQIGEIWAVICITRETLELTKDVFGLFKFLLGDTPDQKALKLLEEQSKQLQAIIDQEEEIENYLTLITAELEFNNLLQAANSFIGPIRDRWNDLNNMAKAGYGKVDDLEMKRFVGNVMAAGGKSIEVGVEAFHQALVIHPPGSPNCALEQARDIAFAELAGNTAANDFSCTVESTNGVGIIAERPMYFNFEGKWEGGHSQMGIPQPRTAHYMAEGTTRPNFVTYLCFQNPDSVKSEVKTTFMRGDGTTETNEITVMPYSRATINVNNLLGQDDTPASDFSVKVSSTNDVPIVAERVSYFNYKGKWSGGHCSIGIGSPQESFFFAEGTVRPDFDTFFCIQNPSENNTDVKITYMHADGSITEQKVETAPHSRSTICVSDFLGSENDATHDFSALVESISGEGVVVERPMYFNYRGMWNGGHCGGGTDRAQNAYFAEGTTRPNFDTFFCIQNPNAEKADIQATYMRGDGSLCKQNISVPGKTRFTVKANDVLGVTGGPADDFSVRFESTNGLDIVVERSMYFNYRNIWNGGHTESGITKTSEKYSFAEGTIRPGFETYICIQNPEDREAKVRITYMKGDGSLQTQNITVGRMSRSTIRVEDSYTKKTLMRAYQDNIENLFVGAWIYQMMGATVICNARDYDPSITGTSEDYMNKYYLQYMNDEVEMFLRCTEQLVMSQVDTSKIDRSKPDLFEWPADAAAIFSRADKLGRMATGKGSGIPEDGPYTTMNLGLCGRMVASQDLVQAGSVPPLKAKRQSDNSVFNPSSSESISVPWLSIKGSNLKYDFWTTDQSGIDNLSLCGDWTVIRYAFDNMAEGLYSIYDSDNNLLAKDVNVTREKYTDPLDQSNEIDIIYGSFGPLKRTKGGPGFLLDSNKWVPTKGHKGSTDSIVDPDTYHVIADPKKGEAGVWSWIKNDDHNKYVFNPYAYLKRSFIAAEDMDIYIDADLFLSRCVDAGDDYENYPNGEAYGKRGQLYYDFNVTASYTLSMHSSSSSSPLAYLAQDAIEAIPAAGGWHRHKGYSYSEKPIRKFKIHLQKGRTYTIFFEVTAILDTDRSHVQANSKVAIRGLRILGF